jgi:hypothetical protein
LLIAVILMPGGAPWFGQARRQIGLVGAGGEQSTTVVALPLVCRCPRLAHGRLGGPLREGARAKPKGRENEGVRVEG